MPGNLGVLVGRQLAAAHRGDDPRFLWHYDNVRTVYVLCLNLEPPYAGGEFIVKLELGDSFPQSPPRFEVLTPTGVYVPGGPICISIGEFHANQAPGSDGAYGWRPALGLRGFMNEVVNGLYCPETLGHGIRIEVLPEWGRRKLAAQSKAHNEARFPGLMASFGEAAAGSAARFRRLWQVMEGVVDGQAGEAEAAALLEGAAGADPAALAALAAEGDLPVRQALACLCLARTPETWTVARDLTAALLACVRAPGPETAAAAEQLLAARGGRCRRELGAFVEKARKSAAWPACLAQAIPELYALVVEAPPEANMPQAGAWMSALRPALD